MRRQVLHELLLSLCLFLVLLLFPNTDDISSGSSACLPAYRVETASHSAVTCICTCSCLSAGPRILLALTLLSGLPSFLAFLPAVSGTILFSKTYDSYNDVYGGYIAAAPDEQYYITGKTYTHDSNYIVQWTIKVNSTGAILWDKTSGYSQYLTPSGILRTEDDGCLILAYGNYASSECVYGLKYSPAGAVLWQTSLTTARVDVYGATLLTDGSGYALVGSDTSGYSYVGILTKDGSAFSFGEYTAKSAYFRAIVNTTSGKLAVAGYSASTPRCMLVTFSSTTPEAATEFGSSTSRCHSLTATSDGNLVLLGETYGSSTFSIFAVKTTLAGVPVWSGTYGNSAQSGYGRVVKEFSDGYLIIGGYAYMTTANMYTNDFWTFSTDSTGTLMWANCVSQGTYNELRSFALSPDEDTFAAAGYVQTTSSDTNYPFYYKLFVFANYTDCQAGQKLSLQDTYCSDCDPGEFQVGVSRNHTCQKCPAGQYQASSGKTGCECCAIGHYQDAAGQTVCKECDIDEYQNETGQADCVACDSAAREYQDVKGSTYCKTCDEDQFYNVTIRRCQDCLGGCAECSDEKTCTTCLAGYIKKSSKGTDTCIQCATDEYVDGSICEACSKYCSQCTGPTNTECYPGKCRNSAYPLEGTNTTCLYNCKTKDSSSSVYLDESTRTCKYRVCHSSCKTCVGTTASDCTSCSDQTKVLYNNQCLDECPAGYYVGDDNICFTCSDNCLACTAYNGCTKCSAGTAIVKGYCKSSCPEGYFLNSTGSTCDSCISGCATCANSESCLKCQTSFILYGSSCISSCPSGTYESDDSCYACATQCTECFGPSYKECSECDTEAGYFMIADSTCYFYTCAYGSYYNLTLKKCADCPTGCARCDSSTKCTACNSGYKLTSTWTCTDPCATEGFTKDATTGECKEICGDGLNLGVNECDDGNRKSGDGCSSDCTIERYYECSSGGYRLPDVCVYRKLPTIVSAQYFGNRSMLVNFDAYMQATAALDLIFSFSLSSDAETEITSWTYQLASMKRFRRVLFHFVYSGSLTGTEYLTLTVNTTQQAIFDLSENALSTSSVRVRVARYSYISDSDKNTASASGSVSFYATALSMITGLGISFVFNTPIEGMWVTMSVMQITSYITLLKLHLPSNLLVFLDYIESVYNFNKFLPNPFSYVFLESRLNMAAFSQQFDDRGFCNCNALLLSGSDLAMLVIMSLALIVLVPLSGTCSLFGKLLTQLRYNMIIRTFIQSYLKLCLAAAVNATIYEFDSPTRAISALIAFMLACVLIAAPSLIAEFLYRHHEDAKRVKKFRDAHASYIKGFRVKSNIMNLMFYPIFLFRRLAFAATVVLLSDYPSLQLSLITVGTFAFVFYVLYWKPFNSWFSWVLTLASEGVFGTFTVFCFAFVKPEPDNTATTLGWLMIGMVVADLLASWVLVACQQFVLFRHRRRRKERNERELAQRKGVEEVKSRHDSPIAEAFSRHVLEPVPVKAGPLRKSKSLKAIPEDAKDELCSPAHKDNNDEIELKLERYKSMMRQGTKKHTMREAMAGSAREAQNISGLAHRSRTLRSRTGTKKQPPHPRKKMRTRPREAEEEGE